MVGSFVGFQVRNEGPVNLFKVYKNVAGENGIRIESKESKEEKKQVASLIAAALTEKLLDLQDHGR